MHSCTDNLLNSTPDSISAELLMSAGFAAKELRKYDEALNAFTRALASQPSASTVPYLIIEIGALLKSKGSYDEAIALFSDAQKLPVLICNHLLQQEFVNMVAYLRITKNVLLVKGLSLMAFSQIPAAVVAEIDAEYTEWNKLGEAI
jgi:tetratricopeptide (TPR) repeat protein